MARTSPGAVASIIGVDPSLVLTGFIDTAASLVSKVKAADTSSQLSKTDLELIERWLAAHFYAHRDQLLQSKSEGRASGSFQGQTAMHFNSTQYGQTAVMLDVTGYLARLQAIAEKGGKGRMGFNWLGSDPQKVVTPSQTE